MSTDHLSPLTAEQISAACARQGVDVSATQLGRWAHAGLLPAPRRQGKTGEGRGVRWLWEAECVPRALIIHEALAQGDPSLHRAARALAYAGYAPSAERLRRILLDGLEAFEWLATYRQGYLTDERPVSEKRRQLSKNMRRKMASMPDPFTRYLTTFGSALHGLISSDDPDAHSPAGAFAQYISFPTLRERLSAVDDSTLLAKYEEAGRQLPSYLPTFIMVINVLVLPLLAQRLQASGGSVEVPGAFDLAAILAGIEHDDGHVVVAPSNPAGLFRLIVTFLLAVLPTENTALLTDWGEFVSSGTRLLADYLGTDWPLAGVAADPHEAERRSGEGKETEPENSH